MRNIINGKSERWSLVGAVAAAVGASVCCVGPLVLLALGIGGAWIGNLTAMEKYRPIFTALAIFFLGMAFICAYRKQREKACSTGSTCLPDTRRSNRIILWIVAVLILGLLALPYAIPYVFAGSADKSLAVREVTLSIRNMTCGACPIIVKKSLTRVDGVRDAKVTFDPPRAVVTYDPAKASLETLVDATTRAGFPSKITSEGENR